MSPGPHLWRFGALIQADHSFRSGAGGVLPADDLGWDCRWAKGEAAPTSFAKGRGINVNSHFDSGNIEAR